MCTNANVIQNGKVIECETVGQLAAALCVTPADVSDDPPDHCLCNARWESIGARRATDAEGWPFPEYIIEQPNAGIHRPQVGGPAEYGVR